MCVQYDGTDFAGFQVQVGQRTVQETLEAAVLRITGEAIRVVGAGRTDAGVHATGQVISFATRNGLESGVLQRAMNAVLPEDVAIASAADAPDGFHARFSAKSRTYRYTVWNGPERTVIGRRYAYPWRAFLDTTAMDQAAGALVGRHDFAAFAGVQRAPNKPISTVRTLFRLHCWRDRQQVFVEATADGFLPHMVRNLVGSLMPVGMRRANVDDVLEILASRDRRRAGRTIPARGLCLTGVAYN